MILVFATGSNLGDSLSLLERARHELAREFHFIAASRIYLSKAVGYTNQPDFYNQVLEFKADYSCDINQIWQIISRIENDLGRQRNIPQGPRTIDIDLLFVDHLKLRSEFIEIPHPRLFERSFVVYPLMELPCFDYLSKKFTFPDKFSNSAEPIS